MDSFILVENYINNILEEEITNEKLIELYFNIGKILLKKSSDELSFLEINLKSKYGIIIGFTKRNFKNMINFYKMYKNDNLENIKKVSWKNHLIIMKEKGKINLIEKCVENNLTKDELLYYIKHGIVKKTTEQEQDEMLEELIELKNTLDKK